MHNVKGPQMEKTKKTTSQKLKYSAEVTIIKSKLGDIEDIRNKLFNGRSIGMDSLGTGQNTPSSTYIQGTSVVYGFD